GEQPALLEREDCTLVTWYRSLDAPRTGGAYDSHHRTTGVAGRTRRRGGSVAARGARAAGGNAGGRVFEPRGVAGVRLLPADWPPARLEPTRLRRRPEPVDRISLGGKPSWPTARVGGWSGPTSGDCDRRGRGASYSRG